MSRILSQQFLLLPGNADKTKIVVTPDGLLVDQMGNNKHSNPAIKPITNDTSLSKVFLSLQNKCIQGKP